jgi:hypothetical protein
MHYGVEILGKKDKKVRLRAKEGSYNGSYKIFREMAR